ncbi:beta-ketoacyl reductase [Mesorhizobium sp. M0437]
MAPKVTGGLLLHQAFPPGSLDFFIQFSSSGQFARLTGQASYAASNAFLDAHARHRNTTNTRDSLSISGLLLSYHASLPQAHDRWADYKRRKKAKA